ncbi:13075_t:CDS:2, partial [Gigaspora margarita]
AMSILVRFTHGLYWPTDITPYIHVLVYHVSEFIDKHRDIGFVAFSCGGKEETRKPAIVEIMEYENQCDYFYFNNITTYFEK